MFVSHHFNNERDRQTLSWHVVVDDQRKKNCRAQDSAAALALLILRPVAAAHLIHARGIGICDLIF